MANQTQPGTPRPRVIISRCLIGDAVRYDGGHKRAAWLEALQAEVELLPVCPELEAGLGVPRPPIDLVQIGDRIEANTAKGVDHAPAIRALTEARLRDLRGGGVDGAVLKSKSPSCGLSAPVFGPEGRAGGPTGRRPGLFAEACLEQLAGEGETLCPPGVSDERALSTPEGLATFIEACQAAARRRCASSARSTSARELLVK